MRNKIKLSCGNIVDIYYTSSSKEEIEDVLEETRNIISKWLDGEDVPEEYQDCTCDQEFFDTAICENLADIDPDDYDELIECYY